MTVGRAMEILDPQHREQYESIEPVYEACRMGREALANPLLTFIKQEVPFRLTEVLNLPENAFDFGLIEECVDRLYDNSDIMFNYDAIDSLLLGVLSEHGIETEVE